MGATITVDEDEVLTAITIAVCKTKRSGRWEVHEVSDPLGICIGAGQVVDWCK
jgi:hypothetical protein